MSKILIIDDEADVRIYMSSLLKKHGYDTVTAEDGFAGLELARRERPDLVVLDLLMPRQSGTDFYRHLSHDKDLKDIPVIVVSAEAGRHLASKQPVAVFDKPIVVRDFLDAVESALE